MWEETRTLVCYKKMLQTRGRARRRSVQAMSVFQLRAELLFETNQMIIQRANNGLEQLR